MYQAIYKCRLCGEVFQSGQTGKDIAYSETMFLCVGESSQYGQHGKILHNCSDGSFGIADFQGFKKVGD